MEKRILGLHHVTAIANKAQRNLDFYTKVLGMRLVKKTVNFDDPGTYHFYFGNETGEAGTTFEQNSDTVPNYLRQQIRWSICHGIAWSVSPKYTICIENVTRQGHRLLMKTAGFK